MKKAKIVAIVSGALTLLQMIPFILQTVMQTYSTIDLKVASAIGIIGAADGPTSIVVAYAFNPYLAFLARHGFLLICAVIFIVSTVVYLKKRKQ